jgi:hypothetical protein
MARLRVVQVREPGASLELTERTGMRLRKLPIKSALLKA